MLIIKFQHTINTMTIMLKLLQAITLDGAIADVKSNDYISVAYNEFYEPSEYRAQSDDNKQASEGLVEHQSKAGWYWREAQKKSVDNYNKLLEMGMAKEQARSILPLTVYTQVWWTASFQAIMNFIDLRDEKTAQWEIREYAKVLKEIMLEIYPETTKIWRDVYWK